MAYTQIWILKIAGTGQLRRETLQHNFYNAQYLVTRIGIQQDYHRTNMATILINLLLIVKRNVMDQEIKFSNTEEE